MSNSKEEKKESTLATVENTYGYLFKKRRTRSKTDKPKDPSLSGKQCFKCHRYTPLKMPSCWRSSLELDESQAICSGCIKRYYGREALESPDNKTFILNMESLKKELGIKPSIYKGKEEHAWNGGCKGTYYLVKDRDTKKFCCF